VTWTKVCENFYDDPRLMRAGEDATDLHLRAMVYSNRFGTDGFVPRWCLSALSRKPTRTVNALVRALVEAGAWAEEGEGWRLEGFHDTQPYAADVTAKREAVSESRSRAGKAGNMVRWGRKPIANASQTDGKPIANVVANRSQTHRSGPVRSDPVRSQGEKTPPPPVVASARRVAAEKPAPRAVEAPSTPVPTRTATDRHDLPAVAVEEALIAATGGRLRLSAAAAPIGAALVERLRREGVTLDELPRIAAVIGADGGRLLWPWPPDLRVTVDHLAKPALPDGGGWGCTALGEAVAAARDGGVEALRRRAATSARPTRADARTAHLRAPLPSPEDYARDAAASRAATIHDPAERAAALGALGLDDHSAPF